MPRPVNPDGPAPAVSRKTAVDGLERKGTDYVAKIEIYKKGQGRYTRIVTFVGVLLLVVIGAGVLSDKLSGYGPTRPPVVRYGVPTLLVVGMGWLMFWLVNRPKTADFLIATESEMKKVSWSSKKEIIGSTKVVIVFTFILAAILYSTDVIFAGLFGWLGIMG